MGAGAPLAFRRSLTHTRSMSTDALSSVVSAISSSSPTASIAVSLLNQADASEQQAVATLFSSLGIGRNVNASA